MKLLLVCLMAIAAASAASIDPRQEAQELLREVVQVDEERGKRELAASKRSYSSASYGGGYGYEPNFEYHEPHVPAYPASKSFDLWGFKSAILGALYNAVKAVAGGSIAVKGQVIKGAGNVLASTGRVVASGGQTVSNFGRGVANNALHSAAAVPVVHHQTYAAPAPAYQSYGYGSYNDHHEGPGVIESIHKAKYAVGSAVGTAVGSAVSSAAGAVAGAVSGAANAVSHHVAGKLAPTQHHGYLPAPAAYKPYTASTYGGSLEDSFGAVAAGGYAFGDNHQAFQIQPSISYDLQ